MKRVPVCLDDEVVLVPEEVDLPVAQLRVHGRARQSCRADQLQHPPFRFAPGESRVDADRPGQRRGASVRRVTAELRTEGLQGDAPQHVGFLDGSVELSLREDGGEVEERSRR